jgi:hypothetical protein
VTFDGRVTVRRVTCEETATSCTPLPPSVDKESATGKPFPTAISSNLRRHQRNWLLLLKSLFQARCSSAEDLQQLEASTKIPAASAKEFATGKPIPTASDLQLLVKVASKLPAASAELSASGQPFPTARDLQQEEWTLLNSQVGETETFNGWLFHTIQIKGASNSASILAFQLGPRLRRSPRPMISRLPRMFWRCFAMLQVLQPSLRLGPRLRQNPGPAFSKWRQAENTSRSAAWGCQKNTTFSSPTAKQFAPLPDAIH